MLHEILKERGIDRAAHAAHWEIVPGGWEYPVYDCREADEIVVHRFKAHNHGKGAKYQWRPEKPELGYTLYYMLPGTLEAIASAGGLAFLASGEPDVLAYRAAGYANVLCWFDGEKSVPESLPDDLHDFGVTRLIYFPDNDQTGREATTKIAAILDESGIEFAPYDIGGDEKNDINAVWMECEFDQERFTEQLKSCPRLAFQTPAEPTPAQQPLRKSPPRKSSEQPNTSGMSPKQQAWENYLEEVKQHVPQGDRKGRFNCLNPSHDDRNPSARVSYEKSNEGIYICHCGNNSSWGWPDVGSWLGLHWESYRDDYVKEVDREGVEDRRQQQLRDWAERPLETAPHIAEALSFSGYGVKWDDIPIERLLFSSDDAAALYAMRKRGAYKSSESPVPFPFSAFHHLGGVFEVGSVGDSYGFLGLSGMGKTSFLEAIIDTARQYGFNCLLLSPEIPWWKLADRQVQRWGGATVTQSLLDDLAFQEERQPLNGGRHFGRHLTEDQLDQGLRQLDWAGRWPGKLWALDYFGADAIQFLAATYKAIHFLRTVMQQRIQYLVIDYLQLLTPPPSWRGKMTLEDIMLRIRALAHNMGCIPIATSQVRKTDASIAMTGKSIGQDAGMNLRPFQFKGFGTMRPGLEVMPNGKKGKADYVVFNITKNSEGRTSKSIEVQVDWPKMLFVDHVRGGQRANIESVPSLPEDDD